MAFTSETKKELENYISGHLPNKEWYESHFYPFIENKSLRDRLIVEFINARKIYKFFEGLQASDELLLAQIKTQVIMYGLFKRRLLIICCLNYLRKRIQ